MSEPLDFLEETDSLETQPEAEGQQEAAPETPAPEPEASPIVAPVIDKEEKPGQIMVPLAALHEVRDEVRQLKAEREQSRQNQQPVEAPDPLEDPAGFRSHIDEQIEHRLYQERLQISERFAAEKHGQEAVQAARDWGFKRCAEDPSFNMKILRSPDPIGLVVQEYQREQLVSQVDPEQFQQFQAWVAAQSAPAQPQPSPTLPPKSIANAPAAGGVQHQVSGPGVAFDELFGT